MKQRHAHVKVSNMQLRLAQKARWQHI